MNKKCLYCQKEFITDIHKKNFCSYSCQQEYWRHKRNKTGLFNRRNQQTIADNIRNTQHLSPEQLQLCYGTILGDASISPRNNGRCRMKLSHCTEQKPYLLWKMNKLKPFILQENLTKDGPNMYSFSTITHSDFALLYHLLYKTSKKKRCKYITMKNLLLLQPLAILIWYLDDGCITADHEMRLGTNRYTLSEHQTIKKWFWQKHRIETIIARNSIKNSYFLRFNVRNSAKLMQLFLPYTQVIPECMHYKFHTYSHKYTLPADNAYLTNY
jgi:hypothetical protein